MSKLTMHAVVLVLALSFALASAQNLRAGPFEFSPDEGSLAFTVRRISDAPADETLAFLEPLVEKSFAVVKKHHLSAIEDVDQRTSAHIEEVCRVQNELAENELAENEADKFVCKCLGTVLTDDEKYMLVVHPLECGSKALYSYLERSSSSVADGDEVRGVMKQVYNAVQAAASQCVVLTNLPDAFIVDPAGKVKLYNLFGALPKTDACPTPNLAEMLSTEFFSVNRETLPPRFVFKHLDQLLDGELRAEVLAGNKPERFPIAQSVRLWFKAFGDVFTVNGQTLQYKVKQFKNSLRSSGVTDNELQALLWSLFDPTEDKLPTLDALLAGTQSAQSSGGASKAFSEGTYHHLSAPSPSSAQQPAVPIEHVGRIDVEQPAGVDQYGSIDTTVGNRLTDGSVDQFVASDSIVDENAPIEGSPDNAELQPHKKKHWLRQGLQRGYNWAKKQGNDLVRNVQERRQRRKKKHEKKDIALIDDE